MKDVLLNFSTEIGITKAKNQRRQNLRATIRNISHGVLNLAKMQKEKDSELKIRLHVIKWNGFKTNSP